MNTRYFITNSRNLRAMKGINKIDNNIEQIWQVIAQLPDNYILTDDNFNIIRHNLLSDIDIMQMPVYEFAKTDIDTWQIFIEQPDKKQEVFEDYQFDKILLPSDNHSNYLLYKISNLSGENSSRLIQELRLEIKNLLDEKSQILDSMTDGAVLIGTDFKIKYANKTFSEVFNTEKPEGEACYKVINNLQHQCMNCSLQKVIQSRATYQNTRSEKNGPIVLSTTFPVFDLHNQINAAVVTFRDVTEKRNMEKAFKKESTINKTIAEISRQFLMPHLPEEKIAQQVLRIAMGLTKSTVGFVSSVEPSNNEMKWKAYENFSLKDKITFNSCHQDCGNGSCFFDHLKHSNEVFITSDIYHLIQEKGFEPCLIARKNSILAPAIYQEKLIGQIFVSGNDLPYSDSDKSLLNQLSSIYAMSIYRLHMEHQLIEAKEAAEESNRLKTAFLANMSHEIRTPMNSINGFSEVLRNTNPSEEERRRFIDIIYKSSNQLLSIINNILDISKLEVGQIKIVQQNVDINQLIADITDGFETEVENRQNIELRHHFGLDGKETIVSCDATRVQQVINNLIQNAIKFTDSGLIEVGYELNVKSEIQFFVKDTGIGIPIDKQEMIFDRFNQVESTTARNYGGTGLGLAISKGLVELMGGKIWVESEPGQGSVFQFSIPYKPVYSSAQNTSRKSQGQNYNWKGKTILLVEDEVNSQNFMQTVLLPFGPKMVYAMDGFEAVKKAGSMPEIDLILMDIRLPLLDGIEATRKIRQLGITKPIIAQTANALPEDRKHCIDAGCNEFYPKPIVRGEFLKTVDYYLGN
jgi:signal transduction histidine kinase/PAS domain-containing protein